MEFNGSIQWTHTSGNFNDRPHINRGDGTHVSGLALRQENYYFETLVNVEVGGGPLLRLEYDGRNSVFDPPPVIRKVKLHPRFATLARYSSGGFDEWIARIYRNDIVVASGWFRWNAASAVNEFTYGIWETNGQPANIIYDVDPIAETADNWGINIDNDGSGTTVTTTVNSFQVGFIIMDNDSDI